MRPAVLILTLVGLLCLVGIKASRKKSLVKISSRTGTEKVKEAKAESTGNRRQLGFDSAAGVGAATGADTGAGASSNTATNTMSGTESQTVTHTKVKTLLRTASNAQSEANVAAKVKAYAHANAETRVKAENQNQPPPQAPAPGLGPAPPNKPTTPRTAITSPTRPNWSPTPHPVTRPPSKSNSTQTKKETECNIICIHCPYPCPYPCPCPCTCMCQPPAPTAVPYCCCSSPCGQPPPLPPPLPPVPCVAPCYNPPQQYPTYPQPTCLPTCVPSPQQPCGQQCSTWWDKRRLSNRGRTTGVGPTKSDTKDPSTYSLKIPTSNEKPSIFKASNYPTAAVASDHHKCSEIGKDILKKGGSAVDSAIATHMCVEVINSHSTGLGGGGFIIAYDKKTDKSIAVDSRETLPLKFKNEGNKTQGETILVPGILKGLHEAHKIFGRLPWKDLFQPAIKVAREGFHIHAALAHAIEKKKDYIFANLGLRQIFAPDGYILREGNLLKRNHLARTFQRIADSGGSDIFYKGEIAEQIVKDIREAGGAITKEDLANYTAVVQEPLKTTVMNMTLFSSPPPAGGALLALMLHIIEKFQWTADRFQSNPALFYHDVIEAMKFAYAPSSFLGDPKFTKHVDSIVKYMLDPDVAENMFKRIDNYSHVVHYYGPFSRAATKVNGTSHLSVVGPDGDACSITSSINAYFGSKVASTELGIIYNNEISDFSEFWPSQYNLTKDEKIPGKRPMSKVAPSIFIDNNRDVRIVIGAAGGFFIPSALIMTLTNLLFLKDNIRVAVSRPRIHCQLFPPTVVYEPTFPTDLVPDLVRMRHQYVTNSTYDVSGQANAIMGVVQAIVRESDGTLSAECDYRKGGLPAGF